MESPEAIKTASALDEEPLGVCTTVLPKATVTLLGDALKVISEQNGVRVADTNLGTLLFGSVDALQKAGQAIKQFKTKLEASPKKSDVTKETASKVIIIEPDKEFCNKKLTESTSSTVSPTNTCKITIKDSTKDVPKLDTPRDRTVVLNIISKQKNPDKPQETSPSETLQKKPSCVTPAVKNTPVVSYKTKEDTLQTTPALGAVQNSRSGVIFGTKETPKATSTVSIQSNTGKQKATPTSSNALQAETTSSAPREDENIEPINLDSDIEMADDTGNWSEGSFSIETPVKDSERGKDDSSSKKNNEKKQEKSDHQYCLKNSDPGIRKIFVCVACKKEYEVERDLGKHIMKEHCGKKNDTDEEGNTKGVLYACNVCPVTVPTAALLTLHVERFHIQGKKDGEDSDTKTPRQKHRYVSPQMLLRIQQWKEEGTKTLYDCELCGKTLLSRRGFRRHIAQNCMYLKDNQQASQSDKEKFLNRNSKVNKAAPKKREGDDKESEKAWSMTLCQYCGKSLSKKSLQRHLRFMKCRSLQNYEEKEGDDGQTGEIKENKRPTPKKKVKRPNIPHLCELCGISLANLKSYKKHVKRNTCMLSLNRKNKYGPNPPVISDKDVLKKYPYHCEVCNKRFTTRRTLLKHKKFKLCPSTMENDPPWPRYSIVNHTEDVSYSAMGFDEEQLEKDAKRFPIESKYIHQCTVCSYTSTYYGLDKHVTRSHTPADIACPHCPRKFALKWTLQDHLKSSHAKESAGGEKAIKDPSSESTEEAVDALIKSLGELKKEPDTLPEQTDAEFTEAEDQPDSKENIITEKVLVTCEECKYTCTAAGMHTHMMFHGKEAYTPCIICAKRLSDRLTIKKHLSRHYDPKTKELILPKSTGNHPKKSAPRTVIAEAGTYFCHQCGAEFDTPRQMKRHLKRHDEDRDGNYTVVYKTKMVPKKCDCPNNICLKGCINEKVKRNFTKYGCPIEGCNVLLTRRSDIPRHMKNVHDPKDACTCLECGRHFKHRKNLDIHVRMLHRKEVRVFCHQCGKGFFDNIRLRAHLETHKERSQRRTVAACEVCGKIVSKKSLKSHMAIKHSGERPYECNVCGKLLATPRSVKNHMFNVHSQEKPYICPERDCGKAFRMRCKLKDHMVTHTKQSRYTCEYCDKPFTQKSTLRRHQETNCDQAEQSPDEFGVQYDEDTSQGSFSTTTSEVKLVQEPQVFMCSVCQATFLNINDIERHLRMHETQSVEIMPEYQFQQGISYQ